MHNKYYSTVRDFIALLKPRVMSLVVFTGIIGLCIFNLMASVILNGIFLYLAYRLLRNTDAPLRLFRYSIIYLFLLFAAVLTDGVL